MLGGGGGGSGAVASGAVADIIGDRGGAGSGWYPPGGAGRAEKAASKPPAPSGDARLPPPAFAARLMRLFPSHEGRFCPRSRTGSRKRAAAAANAELSEGDRWRSRGLVRGLVRGLMRGLVEPLAGWLERTVAT